MVDIMLFMQGRYDLLSAGRRGMCMCGIELQNYLNL
jgi:hypothetical protein